MKCCICGHETESLDYLKERCIIRKDGKARYIPAGYAFPPADMAGLVHFPEVQEKELDLAAVACICKKDRCRKRAARLLAGKPATGTPTPQRRGRVAFGMSSVLPGNPPGLSARHARQERRQYGLRNMSEADFH